MLDESWGLFIVLVGIIPVRSMQTKGLDTIVWVE